VGASRVGERGYPAMSGLGDVGHIPCPQHCCPHRDPVLVRGTRSHRAELGMPNAAGTCVHP